MKKLICKHCGGVIGDKTIDLDNGIFPCDCESTKLKNKKLKVHWKNGREKYNN